MWKCGPWNENEMMKFETKVRDFCPDHIFDCGQCFRWSRQEDGSWTGIAGSHVANVKLIPDTAQNIPSGQNIFSEQNISSGTLIVTGICGRPAETEEEFREFWRAYLDLDRNYSEIKDFLRDRDSAMDRVIASGEGIRILKQDLWETMISFIISQNNNIPRIRGCIESLARSFGTPAGRFMGEDYYSLPSPETLAGLVREDLEVCRLGYRGPYLMETARQVLAAGGMKAVELQLAEAKEKGPEALAEALREFSGIGPKVAGCIALFGMADLRAFPVDVWMRRIMHEIYGIDEKNVREMERRGREDFAPWGGLAQQYLFFYARQ